MRFILIIDRDGLSVSWTHGRRLALWVGSAKSKFGRFEVFTPREGFLR